MGDKNEPHNNTPDLQDALRSIDAIGEDQSGLGDSASGEDRRTKNTDDAAD